MDSCESSLSKNFTSTPKTTEIHPNVAKKGRFDSPVSRFEAKYSKMAPITPMPNYNDMETPEVQRQAQKYGLKRKIGKSKLRMKLKEVYMYTHQTTSVDEDVLRSKDEVVGIEGVEALDARVPPDKCNNIEKSDLEIVENKADDDRMQNISCSDIIELDLSSDSIETKSYRNTEECKNPAHLLAPTLTNLANESNFISLLDSSNEENPSHEYLNQSVPRNRSTDLHSCQVIPDPVNSDSDNELPVFDLNKNKMKGCKNDGQEEKLDFQTGSDPSTDKTFPSPNKGLMEKHESKTNVGEVISLLDESDVNLDIDQGDQVIHHDGSEAATDFSPFNKPTTSISTKSQEVKYLSMTNTNLKPMESCDNISRQDIFVLDSDVENSQSDVGSDHEELHHSLFISIHETVDDSSCSSEDEIVCKSLMQRILEKKGLKSQNPDCSDEDPLQNQENVKSIEDVDIQSAIILPPVSKSVNNVCVVYDEKQNSESTSTKSKKLKKNSGKTAKKNNLDNSENNDFKTVKKKIKKVKMDKNERNLAMFNSICSCDEIYDSVLQYKPVYLSKFKRLMEENGIKVSANDLLEFLDNQGITFSTADENKGKTRLKK